MPKLNKKLSKRECLLGFIMLVVIVFGFFKYWYGPKNDVISEWDRKITLIQREIDQNKAVVDGLQQRIVASTRPNEKETTFKDYLQSSRRLAQVVQRLVAEDPSLDTRAINVEKIEEEKGFKQVTFKVEVVGAFPAIGSFVERLENSKVLTEVVEMNISRVDSDLEKCVGLITVVSRLFQSEGGE